MHLHYRWVIGNGDAVHHADVLNVGPAEQNVVVDGLLGQDRIRSIAIFRSERSHCKTKEQTQLSFRMLKAFLSVSDNVHKVRLGLQTPLDDDANLHVCEKALAPFYVAFFSLFFVAAFAKQREVLLHTLCTIVELFVEADCAE